MDESQLFFVVGIVLETIATISNILAFSLPSWIYTYNTDSTIGISYAGLWTFCLDTFYDLRYTYNDNIPLYGCKWIYGEDLKEIRWTILNPG